jgi:hypothetical protein
MRETMVPANVPRPADKSENAARREAQDALAAINDLFGDIAAKSDPVLDLFSSQISSTWVRVSSGGRGVVDSEPLSRERFTRLSRFYVCEILCSVRGCPL